VQPESATWVYFQKGRRERGEREEGREEGREGGGARQAKLLIKTYSTNDPKVQLFHQGKKTYKTKTIIQLQNQIKTNKSLKTKL
jgi:hypothetical protein